MTDIGYSHITRWHLHHETLAAIRDYRPWPTRPLTEIEFDYEREREGDAQ